MSINYFSRKNVLTLVIALLISACGQTTDTTAVVDDSTTAPMQEYPDWGGWWLIADGPLGGGLRGLLRNLNVYQPEVKSFIERVSVPGTNLGGGAVFCVPVRFNGGTNGGGTDAVEFLLTPQRLTITNEDGMLRRIIIDGRPLRENPEPSNGGTSIGTWEGDTLIVETIGLHPDTTFPSSSRPNSPLIGENVHVLERIYLNEQDQLIVDTELTAPQMLVAPINFSTVYRRDPGHIIRDHDRCSLNDRSIDPVTGLERFDMTPPADLPPPPPR